MHINCVICGDNFEPSTEVYVTTCGHMFHYACLIQWIERSKSCPQCRSKCTEKNIHRIYFNITNSEEQEEDSSQLLNRINSLTFKLNLQDVEVKNINEENAKLKKQNDGLRDEIKALDKRLQGNKITITALKEQIEYLQLQSKVAEEAQEESRSLQKKLKLYKSIETLLEGTVEQVEDILDSHSSSSESVKSLATFASVLKREIKIVTDKKKQLGEQIKWYKQELQHIKLEKDKLNEELILVRRVNGKLEQDIQHLQDGNKSLENKVCKLKKAITSASSSNACDTALKRLIFESPIPETMKKPRLSNPEAAIHTSTIVGGLMSPEQKQSSDSTPNSPYPLNLKPCASLLNTKYPQISKNKAVVSESKFSIFQKTHFGKPLTTEPTLKVEESYDGMGGHSKHDVFPIAGMKIRAEKKPRGSMKKKNKIVYPHKEVFQCK